MTKQVKILISIVSMIFLISCIWAVIILQAPEQQMIVILQENQILQKIDLATAENQEFRISTKDGGYNLIRIQDHQICIAEADCPDQTCVNTGILKSQGLPIVCLPHKIIIRFAEEE